jgi:hypothetical protein
MYIYIVFKNIIRTLLCIYYYTKKSYIFTKLQKILHLPNRKCKTKLSVLIQLIF